MKTILRLMAVAIMACSSTVPLAAQTVAIEDLPLGPQSMPWMESPVGGHQFLWQSVANRDYLIDYSPDLVTWHFFPVVIPGADCVQHLAFQSDAPKLFLRLHCYDGLVTDSGATVLPDWWQTAYFGATGQSPSIDYDGDGMSNLQEYLMGTSPVDYYNGILDKIEITWGGDQRLAADTWSETPLSVMVNSVAVNAPVTFTVTSGGALLSETSGGSTATSITMRTSGYGVASVFLYVPAGASATSTIRVSADTLVVSAEGADPKTVSVTTTVVKTDPSVTEPSSLSAIPISPDLVHVTWFNNSLYGTAIWQSADNGATWQLVTTVDPGVSSCDVASLPYDTHQLIRVVALSASGSGGGGSDATLPARPTDLGDPGHPKWSYQTKWFASWFFFGNENPDLSGLRGSPFWTAPVDSYFDSGGNATFYGISPLTPELASDIFYSHGSFAPLDASKWWPLGSAPTQDALSTYWYDPVSLGYGYDQWHTEKSASIFRVAIPYAIDKDVKVTALRILKSRAYHSSDAWSVDSVEEVDLTIPLGETESNTVDLDPPVVDGKEVEISLVPMEMAPEVLEVNSGFNEGRIDPDTGYAIPDCDDVPGVDQKTGCGNGLMALEAVRDHLDGKYKQYQRITDHLHHGFFGISPDKLDKTCWDGATVTISKLDRIDSDTDRPECGQVRFYAKWGDGPSEYRGIPVYDFATLEPADLVDGGINGVPSESVYGSKSAVPDGAQFYMEGVRPGRITLEWRFQKGETDVSYEQTFLVATQKSKNEWLKDVNYQVKLQSTWVRDHILSQASENNELPPPYIKLFPVDLTKYDPNYGLYNFSNVNNQIYVESIYYYYQQLFAEHPEQLYWAGMAKVAGASVYAGMVDMTAWKNYTISVSPANPRIPELTKVINGFLLSGNQDIFNDMSWAHHAYAASGIWALNYLEEQESTKPPGTAPIMDFKAWHMVDDGIQDEDIDSLREGNQKLLRREQEVVMQPLYDIMKAVWLNPGNSLEEAFQDSAGLVIPIRDGSQRINMDELFSLNAKNPIDYVHGPSFANAVPGGLLSNLAQRWAWIDNDQNGMLQIWLGTSQGMDGFSVEKRATLNNENFTNHAAIYSISGAFPPG